MMKSLLVRILLSVVFVVATVVRASDPSDSIPGVVDLTPSNFDSIINGSKHALIEFYAPWCGHCKSLVPTYTDLAAKITSDPLLNSKVVIAKINADEHSSLGERFKVQGFPTIKYFPRGPDFKAPQDYNSARSLDAFMAFIEKKVQEDKSFARVATLTPLARAFFLTEEGEPRDAASSELIAAAAAITSSSSEEERQNAELYVRYVKKAMEKGTVEYLTGELSRLEGLMMKGMSGAKMVEMGRKVSVLTAFTEDEGVPSYGGSEEDMEEEEDDDDDDDDIDGLNLDDVPYYDGEDHEEL